LAHEALQLANAGLGSPQGGWGPIRRDRLLAYGAWEGICSAPLHPLPPVPNHRSIKIVLTADLGHAFLARLELAHNLELEGSGVLA
jgi:hypothetical protein